MPKQKHLPTFKFYWKANLIFALSYVSLAEASRYLASTPDSVTPVWPPDGLAVGAAIIYGNGILPGVFLGSFLANIQAFWNFQNPIAVLISVLAVLGIAGGTTLGTWLGKTILGHSTQQRHSLNRVSDTLYFLLYAGLVGPIVNATIGVAMLVLAQKVPLESYHSIWLIWWISNVGGIFILTPLLLSVHYSLRSSQPEGLWQLNSTLFKAWMAKFYSKGLEALVLVGAIFLIGKAAFWNKYPVAYILIPLLVWSAFRLGSLGTTLSMFIISTIAILGTVRGLGSFAGPDLNQSLMRLQSFVVVVVFTGLILGAVLSEKAYSKSRLKEAYSELQITNDILEKQTQALADKNQQLLQTLEDLKQAQAQLIQSEKMSALGNLVAGVAHEINNPIGFLNGSINNGKDYVQDLLGHLVLYQKHYPNPVAPIQDNAEDIDLEFLSQDLPKLLTSMEGATDRIKGISTSLRTFSRADTTHKVSANLHEGLDSTLLILKYRLKANEHRPEIQVLRQYRELPDVRCFHGQLNQVFMNILANAIDMFDEMAQQSTFADLQAHPQILTIQTAMVTADTAEIRIRDNGKGMTEEVKAQIFDHLFTTKGVGKGTGLGLAIARQIVEEKHQGRLEVQSKLGQGTEFLIALPV
ncbi:MAG: histidine kinase [Oscillatoriales cyanobacterium]|nr:MAG: histidine kinase [Oscillatoriales cyanobacterium]